MRAREVVENCILTAFGLDGGFQLIFVLWVGFSDWIRMG